MRNSCVTIYRACPKRGLVLVSSAGNQRWRALLPPPDDTVSSSSSSSKYGNYCQIRNRNHYGYADGSRLHHVAATVISIRVFREFVSFYINEKDEFTGKWCGHDNPDVAASGSRSDSTSFLPEGLRTVCLLSFPLTHVKESYQKKISNFSI